MQAALVKLAADAGGERFAKPSPEITPVDIGEFVRECIVKVSTRGGVLQYTCFKVAHHVSHQHLAFPIGGLPGVQESSPLLGVTIGLCVEIVQVVQEVGESHKMQDAADDVDPALEAAHAGQRLLGRGTPRRVPGSGQGEEGGDEFAPVRRHPFFQVMGKAAAHPGLIRVRVHADPVRAPGHITTQLDVVAGGHPGGSLRVHAVLGLA